MRIKRNIQSLGLFALCTMTLASCSGDSLPAESEEGTVPITFMAEDKEDEPRSRKTGSTPFTGSDFGVYAYYHGNKDADGKSIMENQQVKNTGTSEAPLWTYSPQKYWPTGENDELKFYACTPFTTHYPAGKTVSDGLVSYTLDGTQDILWAERVNSNPVGNHELTYAEGKEGVNFGFTHKLMKLNFYFLYVEGQGFGDERYVTELTVKQSLSDMTLNVLTGEVAFGETKKDFILKEEGKTGITPELIRPSQHPWPTQAVMYISSEETTLDLELKAAGLTYQVQVTLDNSTEGKNYGVELTFADGTEVKPEVTVQTWTEHANSGTTTIN